jgi:hypothetical protein
MLLPLASEATIEQEDHRCRPHRLPTLYRTGSIQPCWKTPPRSAASQVLTECRSRRRRPSTMPRTALESAEHHQTPRDAASGRTTSEWRPPATNQRQTTWREGHNPFSLALQQISHQRPEQPRPDCQAKTVSLETTPPRRSRRPQAPPSLV